MKVAELVKENNKKRSLLTKENEAYYTDLLVYIRLQWRLSEQQSEEILMEMLDHLLDGQREGKSAAHIFGENPVAFADQLILEIADENKRNMFLFITGLGVMLLGWVLVIRSGVLFIFSYFTEVSSDVNLFQVIMSAFIIILFIIFVISVIFNRLKKDLFKEHNKKRERKSSLMVGLAGGLGMVVILLTIKFLPKIGPTFNFSTLTSAIVGVVLLLIYYGLKKVGKVS